MSKPTRIQKAFATLSKAWGVLVDHAPHMDGEYDNAVRDVRDYITAMHNENAYLRQCVKDTYWNTVVDMRDPVPGYEAMSAMWEASHHKKHLDQIRSVSDAPLPEVTP